MSAYIVDRSTIEILVNAAVSHVRPYGFRWRHLLSLPSSFDTYANWNVRELVLRENDKSHGANSSLSPSQLGQLLWNENVKSVEHRYPGGGELPGPVGETFDYVHKSSLVSGRPKAGDVFKAIASLSYQSSEHPGWAWSEAKAALDALKDATIHALPDYEKSNVW